MKKTKLTKETLLAVLFTLVVIEGIMVGYFRISYNESKAEHASLQEDYNNLTEDYNELEEDRVALRTEYLDTCDKMDELEEQIWNMKNKVPYDFTIHHDGDSITFKNDFDGLFSREEIITITY